MQDLLHEARPGACSHWLKLTLTVNSVAHLGFFNLVTTVLVTLTSYTTQLASSHPSHINIHCLS